MTRSFGIGCSFALCAFCVVAGPIISLTGPTPTAGEIAAGLNNSETLVIGWTQTGSYSNVAVGLELGFGDGSLNTGHAYLTTMVGPGTTVAAEIANAAFTMPTSEALLTVLTVPSLGAGTYWLTLTNTAPGSWFITNNPTLTLDAGVTQRLGKIDGTPIGYPPSDLFNNDASNLRFTIQGTRTDTPEPATLIAVGGGLILLGLVRRRA